MCVYIHFIPNNLWISITGMHFMSVLYFRAEKSEVLSEDLQTVEKRVELVKTVCQSTSKKIAGCLQGQGTDYEKRLVQCDCYLKLKLDTPLISGPHVRLWYFFVIVEKVTWEYSWSWDDRKWYSTWHRLRYGVSDCSVLQWCIYEHLELCSWKNIVYWTTFKCCKTESVHILSVWWRSFFFQNHVSDLWRVSDHTGERTSAVWGGCWAKCSSPFARNFRCKYLWICRNFIQFI